MKKITIFILLLSFSYSLSAQSTGSGRKSAKEERKAEKRQKRNSIIKQEEEGVLTYNKQSTFGVQLRTNGYGVFYELGRMKTPRFSNLYMVELTEIKHPKEEKVDNLSSPFSNSFVFGKINNFYALKLGFGQQYILGQKGNKNGVAVMGLYSGGLSLGLQKPYYLEVEGDRNQQSKYIRYSAQDSAIFANGDALGGGGFTKGWGELTFNPGVFVKTGLRFDFGQYNESIKALEIGLSVEAYSKKAEIMLHNKGSRLFYQGHIAFLFGHRK